MDGEVRFVEVDGESLFIGGAREHEVEIIFFEKIISRFWIEYSVLPLGVARYA